MFMRFLGGGIGHRIWHLLPQPAALTSRKRATFPEPEETSHPLFVTEPTRKRKARADDDLESLDEEEEFEQELEDYDYGEPDAVVEEDGDGDWVDEVDENNMGPEDGENEVYNDDYDL